MATNHRLHFQRVTVAEYPEGYEGRLIDITPGGFLKLRLRAQGALDRRLIEERFELELRPYLLNEARESQTLELWLAEFFDKDE